MSKNIKELGELVRHEAIQRNCKGRRSRQNKGFRCSRTEWKQQGLEWRDQGKQQEGSSSCRDL